MASEIRGCQYPAVKNHSPLPQLRNTLGPEPHASILMLTYNHAPYIRDAIEGVLSQETEFAFELVIGEDCSTDGTRSIVTCYQERYPDRIRVVASEHNVGMHANLRRTRLACRGSFVAFCEGDDYWQDRTKLQRQVDFLAKNPEYGLVHCNYDSYDVCKQQLCRDVIRSACRFQDDHAYLEILLSKRTILTLTVCVRRSLLDKVEEQPECSDESWPMGDTQRWLEISRICKVKYFRQSMATHNYLPESASRSRDRAKTFRFTEKAGELMLHYLHKYPIETQREQEVRRRVTLYMMTMAYWARDREKVRAWVTQLRDSCRPLPLEAHLYLLWTRGPARRVAATLAIWILSNWRRVLRRALRIWQEATLGSDRRARTFQDHCSWQL
jgi:glycosyltransferase involved in cell wall biosynthesis